MKAKKLLAVLLCLAMIATMFPVVVFGQGDGELLPSYRYDFNVQSSPTMAGWNSVSINAQKNPSESSSTMYTPERGYGLISPISSLIGRDRKSASNTFYANDMERDWIGAKDWKFQADVEPGTYSIIVYCTDMLTGTANSVDININGTDCASMSVKVDSTKKMQYALIENITAADGSFLFHFTSSKSGYVNGIEIFDSREDRTPNIVSVTNPADEEIYKGESLPTPPSTVTVELSSGSQIEAAVGEWTLDKEFDASNFTTYTYTGTIPAVEGSYTNSSNLTATFKVNYLEKPYIASVVAPTPILVTTGHELPAFPTEVQVKLNNGDLATVPVGEWTSDNPFNPDVFGTYTYTAELIVADAFSNINNVKATQTVNYLEETPAYNSVDRSMEWLDRGLVAVRAQEGGIFLSWRLLATEYGQDIAFHVYRNGAKITSEPLTTKTNLVDADGKAGDVYQVETILNGKSSFSKEVTALEDNYLNIPIQNPGKRPVVTGASSASYTANDCSAADVDGDGEYEIVVKWYPSNQIDSASANLTSPTIFDCYKLDGTALWRINLGYNITSGAHYSQFLFYDFDQDGKAEFIVKTADGTKVFAPDENGQLPTYEEEKAGKGLIGVVGDPTQDGTYMAYTGNTAMEAAIAAGEISRSKTGHTWGGPEYLTAFDGLTGAIIDTTDYDCAVGNTSSWGDNNYNRADRFCAAVAYLPSPSNAQQAVPAAVMQRGYYKRTVIAAYFLIDGKLEKIWRISTDDNELVYARGVHTAAAADVDGDGFDEYITGAMAIDQDGTLLWALDPDHPTRDLHGDALHIAAMLPYTDNLQIMQPYEDEKSDYDFSIVDGKSGFLIFGEEKPGTYDSGRGCAANITPNPGYEVWANRDHSDDPDKSNKGSIFSVDGTLLQYNKPSGFPCNWASYWDGDLLAELPEGKDGEQAVLKYNWEENKVDTLAVFEGTQTNNSTKNTPNLTADLFGDWREEIVARTSDGSALRVYTTNIPTDYMIYTLMHDPVYRLAVARQNVAYNQPPHPGFYFGEDTKDEVLDMELPTFPMHYTNAPVEPVEVTASADKEVYTPNETITVTVTTADDVQKAYLVSESGSGLVSDRTYVDNGDGTLTWTLTLSLATKGDRTLSVYTDGKDTGVDVSFKIGDATVVEGGEVKLISAEMDATAKVNEPMTATIQTSTNVAKVRLFNENGVGLAPTSCTYVDEGGVRTWTYVLSVGSTGNRTFTVKVAGSDLVWAEDTQTLQVSISR